MSPTFLSLSPRSQEYIVVAKDESVRLDIYIYIYIVHCLVSELFKSGHCVKLPILVSGANHLLRTSNRGIWHSRRA